MTRYEIRSGRHYGESYYNVTEITDIVNGMDVCIESFSTEGAAKVFLMRLEGKYPVKPTEITIESLEGYISRLEAHIANLEKYLR